MESYYYIIQLLRHRRLPVVISARYRPDMRFYIGQYGYPISARHTVCNIKPYRTHIGPVIGPTSARCRTTSGRYRKTISAQRRDTISAQYRCNSGPTSARCCTTLDQYRSNIGNLYRATYVSQQSPYRTHIGFVLYNIGLLMV